jgi:hypothetical protein
MLRDARHVLIAAAIILGTVEPADASIFRMRIEDLSAGVGTIITDNLAGDLAPAADNIFFFGALGAATVSVQVGTASPGVPFPGYFDAINLSSVTINASSANTFRIILEKDFFATAPDGTAPLESSVGGTVTAPLGSTVSFESWANPTNIMPSFGVDQPVGAIAPLALPPAPAGSVATTPFLFGPAAFAGITTTSFTKAGDYSLFSSAVITLSGPGSVTFGHQTGVPVSATPNETVPEPISLAIWAGTAGLAGVVAYWRTRARA